jgi:hypothetical protein
MDKNIFIENYKRRISRIVPEYQKDHYIKDNYICNIFLKEEIKIDIDKAIKIIELFQEARQYIYNLKIGDKIKIDLYGNIEEVDIKKINYKQGLSPNGNKIISTLTVNGNYLSKIKIADIQYRGVKFYDLRDCTLHCNGNLLSFTEYEPKKVNDILETIKKYT